MPSNENLCHCIRSEQESGWRCETSSLCCSLTTPPPPPHQRSVTGRLCPGGVPLNEQRGLYNRLHSSTLISAVICISDSPKITVLTNSQANVHVNNYNVRTKHIITKAKGIRGCTEVFNLTLKSNPNVSDRKLKKTTAITDNIYRQNQGLSGRQHRPLTVAVHLGVTPGGDRSG